MPDLHPRLSRAGFTTTDWSVVLRAGSRAGDESARALATLCETYWSPVYMFIRRQGCAAEEARDLTQDFFVRVLDKNYFRGADPARGRFRAFLITAVRHFLSNERRRNRALKRGGGQRAIALDLATAEGQYQTEGHHELTPERLFDRRWALLLLDRAMARVCDKYTAAGKSDLFRRLQPFLTEADTESPYSDVASVLGMTEGAVKVSVHRLRRQFRDALVGEITQTVSNASDVEAEIRHLIDAVFG